MPPHERRGGGVAHTRCELGTWESDSSCAFNQSIMVPCCHWGQGYKFGDACGSGRDVSVHPTEVIKRVMYPFPKGNPIL